MEVKPGFILYLCLTLCLGQNPELTETVFCQGDTSITYTCVHDPVGNPGILTWVVNGTGLNSFVEGINTMVGDVVTDLDPMRGLTANVTAKDGETLTTMLTIGPANVALIETVIECRDASGPSSQISTDAGPPDVQDISVASPTGQASQRDLTTLSLDFTLSNPTKQSCTETCLVEDEQSSTMLCNTACSSTMFECTGLNLCTRQSYSLVGYTRDRVSGGDRSSPIVFTPDHFVYPSVQLSGGSIERGSNSTVYLSWELDNFEVSIRPDRVFVGRVQGTFNDGEVDIELNEAEIANGNYTFLSSNIADLRNSSFCVRVVNGFCSSTVCVSFDELRRSIYCERLEPPNNGSVSFSQDSLFPETTASFNCTERYRLNGESMLACERDGQWNGSVPSCECVASQPSSNVNHGKLKSVECVRARYSVDDGYCPSTFVAEFECSNSECSSGQWIYPNTSACIAVGTAIGITFVLTFIFTLALGIIIGVTSVLLWNKFGRKQTTCQSHREDVQLKDTTISAIYEDPDLISKQPEDIKTGGNIAYGPVNVNTIRH